MRLLFYISEMKGGGAERVMSVLCNELVSRGYEVFLATNTGRSFAYSLKSEVNVLSLYPDRYQDMNRWFRFILLHRYIRRIACKVRPDVIVSFMGITVKVLPATWGLSIPVIVSEHTTYDRILPRGIWFRMNYIDRLADRLTVLTQHDYNFLGKKLPRKVVMPNPLSYPLYSKKSVRRKNVLAVGRLDAWKVKGFDNLIKVWSQVANLYPEWSLEIVGKGNENSLGYLKSLAKQYGVEKSVHFLGFRSDVDILMQKSAVFVLSSRNEGFPMGLLEAMSQGCACVSFDCVSGPNEIITDGWSGILVENQNLDRLRDALSEVMADEKLRESLSGQSVKEVERFSVGNVIGKWEDLFREVLKDKI